MECPKCRYSAPQKTVICPQCGFNLEWLDTLSKLRESVSGTNADLQKIGLGIQEISSRISLLEKNICSTFTEKKTETVKAEKPQPKPGLSSEMKDIQARLHQRALEAQKKETFPQNPNDSGFPSTEEMIPSSPFHASNNKTTELVIGQKWLLIAGIILMVLGLAYFLKYAMDQNWINPSARIFTGYLSGTLLLIMGENLRKKISSAFGLSLIGGGIAALYLSTFSGFQIYHLFGQIPAFFLLILITAFGYGYAMIKPLYGTAPASLLALLYSAFFMFLAQTAHKKGLPSTPRTLMIAKAILFLILAVPLLFSGHWITLFWLILSMVLYWSGTRIKSSGFQNTALTLFIVSLFKFSFWDSFDIFQLHYFPFHFNPDYSYLASERLFSEFFITGSIFCSLHYCLKRKKTLSDSSSTLFLLSFIFIFFLFSVLTVETDAFFYQYLPKARFASISVLWTLFSLGLIGIGFLKNIPALRYLALSLFLITLIKAFFIDMSHISTPFRIISFIVLGMVMILASFFYHSYKGKINENTPPSV